MRNFATILKPASSASLCCVKFYDKPAFPLLDLEGKLRQTTGAQAFSTNKLLTVGLQVLDFYFIKIAVLQEYFILSSPAKQWIEQIDNSANVKVHSMPSTVFDATVVSAGKKKAPCGAWLVLGSSLPDFQKQRKAL